MKVKQGLKSLRKKRKDKLHSDDSFINYFVGLLFEDSEKEVLFKILA